MSLNTRNLGEESKWVWVLLSTALYIVCIMPYASAELWYDEVLTLTDFSLDLRNQGVWEAIWRRYPMANNHILNSTIYWGWVRLLNFQLLPEQLLRLPSLLFGAGTLWLCLLHWRQWLGARVSVLGGLLLAISPVFTAYAYQVRGYSMTMFLSALCISGALEYYEGHTRRGLSIGCISGVLLPLIMPSNLMLAPLAAVLYEAPYRSIRKKLKGALPVLGAFIAGGAYYLTIWDQFVKTTREPAGWDSAWQVAGNLLLAVLAHLLVLLLPALWQARSAIGRLKALSPKPEGGKLTPWPLALTLGPLVLIAAVLLFSRSGHFPYPRVFLVFLPQVTFALLLLLSHLELSPRHYLLILATLLINGLLWTRIPAEITRNQLKKEISPSNLLQQYYRGSTELRTATETIQTTLKLENCQILTDEYDYPTTMFYVLMYGGNSTQVSTFSRSNKGCWQNLTEPHPAQLIIAKSPDSAASLCRHAGIDSSRLKPLKTMDIRTIYSIEP